MSKDSYNTDYRIVSEAVMDQGRKRIKERKHPALTEAEAIQEGKAVIPAEFIDDRGYFTFETKIKPIQYKFEVSFTPPLPTRELKDGITKALYTADEIEWSAGTMIVTVGVHHDRTSDDIMKELEDEIIDYLDNVPHAGQD